MSFWKKLFGVKQSPKTDMAERESTQPSAASPQLPSIHQAAYAGDLEKVKALLKDHPDWVFSKDGNGWTPLHWAAFGGHKHIAELLLASKAEVNAKSNKGVTPLQLAALMGQKDVVELLLVHQAEVNAKDDNGETPLHVAGANDRKDVAELLRQHGGHE